MEKRLGNMNLALLQLKAEPELDFGGGHLITSIVFSCKKFLSTIVCYKKFYYLRGHVPPGPPLEIPPLCSYIPLHGDSLRNF